MILHNKTKTSINYINFHICIRNMQQREMHAMNVRQSDRDFREILFIGSPSRVDLSNCCVKYWAFS